MPGVQPFEELVGAVPAAQFERLRRVDALLRSLPERPVLQVAVRTDLDKASETWSDELVE